MYDLVIFDCDGVLVDSELISNRNLAAYLSELGMPHTTEQSLERYAGRSMSSVIKLIEDTCGPLPDDFAPEIRRRNAHSSEHELRAIDGIADVLSSMSEAKCVASSGHSDRIRHSLSLTALSSFFGENVFSAIQVKNGKPAPDLFLYAAQQMGATAKKAVVIEDSIPGVQAGVAAGMDVIGFIGASHIMEGHEEELSAAGARFIFDDMRALPGILNG